MAAPIFHRRLYAFYQSKVLNALMMTVIVSMFLFNWSGMALLPAVAGALALLLFIGYSLWLWIKRPTSIVINRWLSDIDCLFALYFLIVTALNPSGQWWYIFPVVVAVVALFISLIKSHDEKFEIS